MSDDPFQKLVHLDLKGAPPRIEYLQELLPFLKHLGATGLLLGETQILALWLATIKFSLTSVPTEVSTLCYYKPWTMGGWYWLIDGLIVWLMDCVIDGVWLMDRQIDRLIDYYLRHWKRILSSSVTALEEIEYQNCVMHHYFCPRRNWIIPSRSIHDSSD